MYKGRRCCDAARGGTKIEQKCEERNRPLRAFESGMQDTRDRRALLWYKPAAPAAPKLQTCNVQSMKKDCSLLFARCETPKAAPKCMQLQTCGCAKQGRKLPGHTVSEGKRRKTRQRTTSGWPQSPKWPRPAMHRCANSAGLLLRHHSADQACPLAANRRCLAGRRTPCWLLAFGHRW